MHKTMSKDVSNFEEKVAVNTENLMKYLDCGRKTAVEIGEQAGARIQWGRRVLWSIEKVKTFIQKESY